MTRSRKLPASRVGRVGTLTARVQGWVRRGRGWLIGLLLLVFSAGASLHLQAQEPDENAVFAAAGRAFQDGIYDRAERELAAFREKFPQSANLPEATLLQARAVIRLGRQGEAIQILQENLPKAGALGDQYQYWMAEAYLQSTNYQAAAEAFARLANGYTNSVRLLEAGYGEALARYKLRDWPKVVELLQKPDGTFQRAAPVRANDELVVRGQLLLAEALLEQQKFEAALAALAGLTGRELVPEIQWRRQYVLSRVLREARRLPEALAATTNLITIAGSTGQPNLQAESVTMQASVLEDLGRREQAIGVLEQNLVEGIPLEQRRQSLLKLIRLELDLDRTADASKRLEAFFGRYPDDAASDIGLLTAGEIQLKQAFAKLPGDRAELPVPVPASLTNYIQTAKAQFQSLITNYSKSSLAGKAWLDYGWCLWLEGDVAASKDSFQRAVDGLSFSPSKAEALFKLADAMVYLADYTNALSHYEELLRDYVEVSEVRQGFFDHALYQTVRIRLELDDQTGATQAMNLLVREHPESPLADRAMMLVAQALSLAGKSAASRAILDECLKRYPDRSLVPSVQMALARTYVEDQNWTDAIAQYEQWLARFPTNAFLPRVEFNLAWSNYRAGHETNAFGRFTNFIARFPTHDLAPEARLWLGDYYLRQRDDLNAQNQYQDTNLLASSFGYLARMMAGRAAFAGGRWKDARYHFNLLINESDTQRPKSIAVEALFGLGDTIIREEGDREKPLQKFQEAIVVFSKIPQLYPADPRVPMAWGRIGECYFTIAESDPKHYETATNAFQRVLESPEADVGSRRRAEMGLGAALEKYAKTKPDPESKVILRAALDHYLNIVYGTSPVLAGDEKQDPFWLKEAGLAAGKLAEELQEWEAAVKLYERLMTLLPPLRFTLEKRIQRVREQLAAGARI